MNLLTPLGMLERVREDKDHFIRLAAVCPYNDMWTGACREAELVLQKLESDIQTELEAQAKEQK